MHKADTGWEMSTCLKYWHHTEDPQAMSALCVCVCVFTVSIGAHATQKPKKEKRNFYQECGGEMRQKCVCWRLKREREGGEAWRERGGKKNKWITGGRLVHEPCLR